MKRPLASSFGIFAALAIAPALCAQTPATRDALRKELHAKLERQLQQIAAEFDGVMGIAVTEMGGGETFLVNADTVFPQASSIKITILIELLRQDQAGTLRLTDRVDIKRAQIVGGSGILQYFSDGTSTLSLRDLAVLMINLSDNSATNILIDRVGMDTVNATLERLGLHRTRLQRRMIDAAAQRASRENVSTPAEMIFLLYQLQRGSVLDVEHTHLALEILRYRKNTPLRRGLPENVDLADKPGSLAGVRCDSGIVELPDRPYAISVMTTYVKDDDAAERAISEVSRRVFDYFARLARSNALGVRIR